MEDDENKSVFNQRHAFEKKKRNKKLALFYKFSFFCCVRKIFCVYSLNYRSCANDDNNNYFPVNKYILQAVYGQI